MSTGRAFYFYSIIKAFNLGQQFYTQNDQNAICRCRIGNLFEIDMGGAQCRVAPMQPVNGDRPCENGLTHVANLNLMGEELRETAATARRVT